MQSGISLLSAGSGPKFSQKEEDVWCIDYRGVLTLSVCKDTYNGLGLVGKRVAFGKGKSKQGDGRHVISIPLYAKDAESVKIRAHREAALKRWEERRAKQIGSPLWNVLAFSESMSLEELDTAFQVFVKDQVAAPFEIVSVRYQKAVLEDVHVPVVRLTPRPRPQNKLGLNQQGEEDWCETMQGLFEWVASVDLESSGLKLMTGSIPSSRFTNLHRLRVLGVSLTYNGQASSGLYLFNHWWNLYPTISFNPYKRTAQTFLASPVTHVLGRQYPIFLSKLKQGGQTLIKHKTFETLR
ncbi:ribonuclease p protein subunit [Lentinula edodes]|uniref:Ribonuclease p protein subunit n=1 Tax=Lentinula edodes TaxID=5353 RepID=A0A1Q3E9D9_LENED|nr:ribonuclease p protein subunit [Lentinula edodes]